MNSRSKSSPLHLRLLNNFTIKEITHGLLLPCLPLSILDQSIHQQHLLSLILPNNVLLGAVQRLCNASSAPLLELLVAINSLYLVVAYNNTSSENGEKTSLAEQI